jgi:hypothetical protein
VPLAVPLPLDPVGPTLPLAGEVPVLDPVVGVMLPLGSAPVEEPALGLCPDVAPVDDGPCVDGVPEEQPASTKHKSTLDFITA